MVEDEEGDSQEGQQATQGGNEPCDEEEQSGGMDEDSEGESEDEDDANSSELPLDFSEPVEAEPDVVEPVSSGGDDDDGDEEPASGGSSGSSTSRGGSASRGSAGYTGYGNGYGNASSGSVHSMPVDRLFSVVAGGAVALLLV
jgi:hypothetical protein